MNWTDYEIDNAKRMLASSSSVKKAARKMGTTASAMRKGFKRNGEPSPKEFLGGSSESIRIRTPDDVKDRCLVDFENRVYLFSLRGRKPFPVEFEKMELLIRAYVNKGSGMTQTEVCRYAAMQLDMKLTHDYFQRMLKAMDIVKTSLPYAPHEFSEKDAKTLIAD